MRDWHTAPLRTALGALLPGLAVEVLAQIDSTNTELMRRARAGHTAPVLLVAERQTAGRGRLGRSWHGSADDGGALAFSLGLPLAPRDWSGLSLAVGVSVADSLDPGGERLRLKWPNDLWLDGRKLGGILVETASSPAADALAGDAGRHVVIGIGLNLAPRDAQGLATPPAWLHEIDPGVTAQQVFGRVAVPLVAAVLRFGQTGFAPFAPRFAARDALAGAQVSLSDGTAGRAEGVAANGALQVRDAQGVVLEVRSAELSLRPRAAVQAVR